MNGKEKSPVGANVNHYGANPYLYPCQKKVRNVFLFTFVIYQI